MLCRGQLPSLRPSLRYILRQVHTLTILCLLYLQIADSGYFNGCHNRREVSSSPALNACVYVMLFGTIFRFVQDPLLLAWRR